MIVYGRGRLVTLLTLLTLFLSYVHECCSYMSVRFDDWDCNLTRGLSAWLCSFCYAFAVVLWCFIELANVIYGY
jgi:hypothetical protein